MSAKEGTSQVGPRARGAASSADRLRSLRRALGVEYVTVGWNVVEGAVAVVAGLIAGSVSLLAFGLDSVIECASAIVLVWRLRAEVAGGERDNIEQIERRAHVLVGWSLLGLAAWVVLDAGHSLWVREGPEVSPVGIGLLVAALVVMAWLTHAKRRLAAVLDSRALAADAIESLSCLLLAGITLLGIGLHALLGWWWADAVAALGIAILVAREGLEGVRGDDDYD